MTPPTFPPLVRADEYRSEVDLATFEWMVQQVMPDYTLDEQGRRAHAAEMVQAPYIAPEELRARMVTAARVLGNARLATARWCERLRTLQAKDAPRLPNHAVPWRGDGRAAPPSAPQLEFPSVGGGGGGGAAQQARFTSYLEAVASQRRRRQ